MDAPFSKRPTSDRASESPIHELLVCLLACFDDGTEKLHKELWEAKAKAVGYIADEGEWKHLMGRFALRPDQKGFGEPDEPNCLNLGLVGTYFANKHGEVIQELIRRMMIGLVRSQARADGLEERLEVAEAILDRTVLAVRRGRLPRHSRRAQPLCAKRRTPHAPQTQPSSPARLPPTHTRTCAAPSEQPAGRCSCLTLLLTLARAGGAGAAGACEQYPSAVEAQAHVGDV
eukprot:6136374-Prymnesium_polylepis.1